jgi:hypothetical protein
MDWIYSNESVWKCIKKSIRIIKRKTDVVKMNKVDAP